MPALVWALMAAQALNLSALTLMVLIGGVLGSSLHSDSRLATLPVAATVIGTALAVLPAAALAQRYGRRILFASASVLGAVSALVAMLSLQHSSFWGLVLAAAGIGVVTAVVQQYRFVAMAAVSADKQAQAAAKLLLAGLVSAWLGPELSRLAEWWPDYGFIASFAVVLLLYLLASMILFRFVPAEAAKQDNSAGTGRGWTELLRQPALWLAISAAAGGYAVMSYVMTATPLSMTEVQGMPLSDAKWVIQSHITAMFLPSLLSGWLVQRCGYWNMIMAGLLVVLLCLVIAWWDQTLLHYWVGLMLLGLGWNFLFVSATALLPRCYRPQEATRVQGLNDFMVFGSQALSAMASGAVVLQLGWHGLLLTTTPLMILLLAVLLLSRRDVVALHRVVA